MNGAQIFVPISFAVLHWLEFLLVLVQGDLPAVRRTFRKTRECHLTERLRFHPQFPQVAPARSGSDLP